MGKRPQIQEPVIRRAGLVLSRANPEGRRETHVLSQCRQAHPGLGRLGAICREVLDEARDAVTSLVVRGPELVAGSVDGRVRSYDVRAGRCVVDVVGASVTSLDVTRDGKAVLVGALDSKLRLMDRASGACLKTYADAGWRNEEFRVQAVLGGRETFVVAGDELTAAGAGGDGRVWAWELLTGKLMAKVTVPWGPPGSGPKKKVLGRDGKEKERSNVISCLAWKDDGWGHQFCAGGTSGVATVFGPSSS
ncbi:WD repeat domain-containing protein 83 like [Verticillium longisporum]|nr:WD repeat domain-containing protein 83 like [Verticillium longisporum]